MPAILGSHRLPLPAYHGHVSDLSTRYGTRRRPAYRIIAVLLIVAMVGSAAGYLGWVVLFHSNPEVQSRLVSFDVKSERTTTAVLTVARNSSETRAVCRLKALATDHSVVGEEDVVVDSGPETQSFEVTIRTERAATSVDPVGCVTENQARPR